MSSVASSTNLNMLPTLASIRHERARRIAKKPAESLSNAKLYAESPAVFAQHCISWPPGEKPTPYQMDCWRQLVLHKRRLCIRGPHGLGKTAIAAITIHWFALTRDGGDWKIATTASSWRQLQKFLWPEVHKWARRIRWDVLGRPPYRAHVELTRLSLRLSTGEAFAVASEDASLIEGAHADHLLYVFDEARSISGDVFDAAEGAFSGALGEESNREAMALVISTPGQTSGRFWEIHSHKVGLEDWTAKHVKLSEAVDAGRVSEAWVEQRRRQWGSDSSVFKNRVLGEFSTQETDGVIPYAWVEQAVERWHKWKDKGGDYDQLTSFGVDVAGGVNRDKTVVAPRVGWIIPELRITAQQDTMGVVGLARRIWARHGGVAVVDVIGIGAGPYHRLKELRVPSLPFNGATRAIHEVDGIVKPITDVSGELQFRNLRAAAWWYVRELLDPAAGIPVALPPDDEETSRFVVSDLISVRRRAVDSSGVIQLEEKEQVVQRLGRSPDCGDAVVMAFAFDLLQPTNAEWNVFGLDLGEQEQQHLPLTEFVKEHGVYMPGVEL